MPADHIIKSKSKFVQIINIAIEYAIKGRLVTFGVTPTRPETGYGYIEAKKEFVKDVITGHEINRFIEKPNIEKARKLITDKRYSWNSGIFLFKADSILSEIEKFNTNMISSCEESLKDNSLDLDFQRIEKKTFATCENISIDKAVMEKTNLGTVLPLEVDWSDIGSWDSLWENESKDINGNVVSGKVLSQNSKNCYLKSENKLLVGIGLEEIVIVETQDATLVANKKFSQQVKEIVEKLNQENFF